MKDMQATNKLTTSLTDLRTHRRRVRVNVNRISWSIPLRTIVGALAVSAAVAANAATYKDVVNANPKLCKEFKQDLIVAKIVDMKDEDLCKLEMDKVVPQIHFVEWQKEAAPKSSKDVIAARAAGSLPGFLGPRVDLGIPEFIQSAVADGDLYASTAVIQIGNTKFNTQRIDTSPCRLATKDPLLNNKRLYKWIDGFPQYAFTSNGQRVPFTIDPGGHDLGFEAGKDDDLLALAVSRSWTNYPPARRTITAEIRVLSYSVPNKDHPGPIDSEAGFKPFFWVGQVCQIDINAPPWEKW